MKRVLIVVLWYLTIGLAVGIETGSHQARRFDPGFDPLFTAVVAVFVWPVVVWQDLAFLVGHFTLPRR